MLVLSKKRLSLILGCLFLSIFSFMFIVGNSSNNEEEAISTVTLPVSNKTIILDAGHGVPDERC